MNRFEYIQASTLSKAQAELNRDALPKAGGTDLLLLMKEGLIAPRRLVNLLGVATLRETHEGPPLRIGALVTLAELAVHPQVQAHASALATAAGDAATPQIRHMATLGGNLCQRPRCWYFRSAQFQCKKKGGETCFAIEGDNRYHAIFGDPACPIVHPSNLGAPLVALNALFNLQGPDGPRKVSAESFFTTDRMEAENLLGAGELVTAIEIEPGWRSVYLELRERKSFDWPLASVAMARREGAIRIVLGAVAPRPWRIPAVEEAIQAGDVPGAQKIVSDEAKPLSKNGYKVKLLQALLARAYAAIR